MIEKTARHSEGKVMGRQAGGGKERKEKERGDKESERARHRQITPLSFALNL